MQVSSPKGFHLRGVLENNINYILEPYLKAYVIGLRWFFDNAILDLTIIRKDLLMFDGLLKSYI